MSSVAKSFTAVGTGNAIQIKHKASMSFSVSGTFVGTVILEKSEDGGLSYVPVTTKTAAASGSLEHDSLASGSAHFRFRCSAFTSGTIVTSVSSDAIQGFTLMEPAAGQAKAGTTSGFVVAVADNIALVTCPASKTASTCVVPITKLKVGQMITGFNLVGQIESAGGTVTVDADLRVMTAAAADVTDASVGAITQLSVTAETVMSSSNTAKTGLSKIVGPDENYYVLITATTGVSCDIALQAVAVNVMEGTNA